MPCRPPASRSEPPSLSESEPQAMAALQAAMASVISTQRARFSFDALRMLRLSLISAAWLSSTPQRRLASATRVFEKSSQPKCDQNALAESEMSAQERRGECDEQDYAAHSGGDPYRHRALHSNLQLALP